MTLPTGYHESHGCHDCAHVFVTYENDDEAEYFCALNAPPRLLPNCDWLARRDAWLAWSVPRAVRAWGICPQHQEAKP